MRMRLAGFNWGQFETGSILEGGQKFEETLKQGVGGVVSAYDNDCHQGTVHYSRSQGRRPRALASHAWCRHNTGGSSPKYNKVARMGSQMVQR